MRYAPELHDKTGRSKVPATGRPAGLARRVKSLFISGHPPAIGAKENNFETGTYS